MHYEYTTRVANAGEPLTLDANEEPWHTDEGTCILDTILGTDCMAWITPGTVAVREEEHLGLVDTGILLCRQRMTANIARVQRGEDVFGTVRDAGRPPIHLTSAANMGGGWRGVHGPQCGAHEAQAATSAPARRLTPACTTSHRRSPRHRHGEEGRQAG